jgi:hypothetical protein
MSFAVASPTEQFKVMDISVCLKINTPMMDMATHPNLKATVSTVSAKLVNNEEANCFWRGKKLLNSLPR